MQIGPRGITNRSSFRDFKSGQKDYKSGQRLQSRQEGLQIGAGITNRCRTQTPTISDSFFHGNILSKSCICVSGSKVEHLLLSAFSKHFIYQAWTSVNCSNSKKFTSKPFFI